MSQCPSSGAYVNMAYDGRDQLVRVGFGTTAPSCGEPSIPSATDCLTYDGNGDVATLDLSETGGIYDDQTLTWSTASGCGPTLAVWTVDNNGTTTRTDFAYGPQGLPLEQMYVNGSAQTLDWYNQDPEGNTRELLDSSGSVDQSYNYDLYGNEIGGTSTTGPTTPLLWKGLFEDTVDTGFVFMQARWYDPQTAQFVSRDPLSALTLQPYAFAGDNPVNSSDPTGLCNSSSDRHLAKDGQTTWDKNVAGGGSSRCSYGHGGLTAIPTTVSQLFLFADHYRPPIISTKPKMSPAEKHALLPGSRWGPVEQNLWQITGRVVCNTTQSENQSPNAKGNFPCRPGGNNGIDRKAGHVGDGDIEFQLFDGTGEIHCEMPHHGCFDNSPWKTRMEQALSSMQMLLWSNWRRNHLLGNFCVTVQGLGFWDLWAHTGDSHPELHPLLSVKSAATCPPLPSE